MLIYASQTSTSLLRIPIWLMGSTGTSPATGEAGGQPQINWLGRGAATVNTTNTLSLVSANAGEYYVQLVASEVSALGEASIQYRSANAIPNSTYFQIVNFDPGDATRLGLTALPNAAASAVGGLVIVGTGAGSLNPSLGSVGLVPFDYSSVVTVGVGKIAPASYSGVSVEVKLGGIQTVSIASATYSGVTFGANPIGDKTLYSINSIVPGSYSGVSVEVININAASAGTIADSILTRSLAGNASGGRTVADAFRVLRNRVDIFGSIMTVYSEDDLTSAWTASVTTVSDTSGVISSINPAGGSA